jgi:hypothetical protein
MKKHGYKLNIYDINGNLFKSFDHVSYFGRFHTGLWIIYDIDEKEIDRFYLREFKDYSIITKNKL